MEKLTFKQSRAGNLDEKINPYLDSLYPLRYDTSDKIDPLQRVSFSFCTFCRRVML